MAQLSLHNVQITQTHVVVSHIEPAGWERTCYRFLVSNSTQVALCLTGLAPERASLRIYPVISLFEPCSLGGGFTKVGFSSVTGSDESVTAWSSSQQSGRPTMSGQSQQREEPGAVSPGSCDDLWPVTTLHVSTRFLSTGDWWKSV